MKGSRMILKSIALSTFIFLLMCDLTYAQPDYSIHISDIRIPETKVKNWYGRPVENDFIVSWEMYTIDQAGTLKSIDSPGTMAYNVYLSKDSTFSAKDTFIATDADTALFAHIKSGTRYYFRVDGIDKLDSLNVVHSDVAWAIGGNKVFAMPELKGKEIEFPLFFPFAELFDKFGWRSTIYFDSGNFGKLAFTLLWLIVILSIGYVVPFRCMKSLDLGRIFPFSNMNPFKRNLSKEQSFDQYMAPRFRFVIEAWKRVITVTNRMALNDEKGSGGKASLETINKKFFDYFKLHGTFALQVLKDVMDFNPQDSDQSEKAELEKRIKEYFDEGADFGGVFAKPHDVKSDNDSAVIFWRDVENDLFSDGAKPISDYATVKILQAGLGNHIINGYHWQIVSEEVDRAIENRAASEHEQLKEKASVDWLWNLGTLSPLLGLFGTVTGISGVFRDLGGMDPNMTQKELVDTLAGGIFEALWTTIYGLMAAILLMILYYNFKNRLDWIYNRWQEIAVRITEKL